MLCAFPQARISSKKALKHPYFYLNEEIPKIPTEIPVKEPQNFNNVIQNLYDYR